MQRSSTKINKHTDQSQEIMIAAELPQHIRHILIDNKRMSKRIQILQTEIEQKNRVISELKNHLDEGVIESTQAKLSYYRTMEQQVDRKVKQVTVKQRYIQKTIQVQQHNNQYQANIANLTDSLNEQLKKNDFLINKIQSLKQYIVHIIDQKDYLISELGAIISEQQKNPCKNCGCLSGQQVKKKANAFIRKNN